MKIASGMKHPVVTVKPRDSVLHARQIMERHRINQLPVVVDSRLIGIVTDRDIRDAFPSVFEEGWRHRRATAADPAAIPVEDVMTSNVLTLVPDAPIEEGARLIRRERIGAIPIVAGDRLVGILTRSDLLDVFLAQADPRPAPTVRRRAPAAPP